MFYLKKSLGQNFLKDRNIIKKIINLKNIKSKDIVEIGPGNGAITDEILSHDPNSLILIEKDNRLLDKLKEKYKKNKSIIFYNDDVLKIDLEKKIKKNSIIFGNLPYNISSQILVKLIKFNKWPPKFSNLILMFQKEVADRIIANVNTSNYGRLSILAKWKLDIVRICNIKPSCFFPKPKIESSLLFFKPKKNFFKIDNPKNIELVTRSFFNHRRKMIKKPFNQLFNGKSYIQKKLKLNLNLRPQNLCLDTYYNLIKEYEKLSG